jgi:membrane protease YdiL (CAAX protease family)
MIIATVTAGHAGFMQLLRGTVTWRVKACWYLVALLGPVAVFVVSGIAWGLVTREWFDFTTYGLSDEFPTLGLAGVWMVHTLTFGIGEEMGWRGFALPRLQAKHNALTATILLTVFWALWHIPAFFYRPGYSSMGAADIVGWFFSLLTGAVLLTWLYNSTQGSILIVALYHGSIDVAFTSKLIDAGVMNTMGALIVIWAIAVLLITGPSNLSFSPRQRSVLT